MSDDFPKLTHGNYHAWAPWMTAELQQLGIWCFCMGNESIPAAKLTAMSLQLLPKSSQSRETSLKLCEATMMLAAGMIKPLEPF